MTAIALINWNAYNALIKEDDGRIFTLETKSSAPEEQSKRFHEGRYLQPAMNRGRIQQRDAGEFPYSEIYKSILMIEAEEVGLRMFLYSIDKTFDVDFRIERARFAEKYLSVPEAKVAVIDALTGAPVTDTSCFTMEGLPESGSYGEVLKIVKEKWGL